jgi:predicted transposase YbfD/YdcC
MPPTKGWESAQQCFRIERIITHKKRQYCTREIVHGITSLPPEKADAARLLELNRNHWRIENQLHWQRDTSFKEDFCKLKSTTAQTINAALNSFAIFLLKSIHTSITEAIETCQDNKSIPINLLCN